MPIRIRSIDGSFVKEVDVRKIRIKELLEKPEGYVEPQRYSRPHSDGGRYRDNRSRNDRFSHRPRDRR